MILTPHQQEHVDLISDKSLSILGGGGGTGKTFVAANMIRDAIDTYGDHNICVGAPTGKAAVRITEAMGDHGIPIKARTWHSHLRVAANDAGGWSFEHNENNPMPFRYFLSDESSMLDAAIMASVMRAIPRGAQFVLVGDEHQLPPVGKGAPMRDMIASQKVPFGELTEIRRNSGRIVKVGHQIRSQHGWSPSESVDLESGENLLVINAPSPQEQIDKMLKSCAAIMEYSLDPVWDVQVIVPVNEKSQLGRKKLNEVLQSSLNENPSISGIRFRVNDKVVNTKNAMFDTLSGYEGEKLHGRFDRDGNLYVANGEQGKVVGIHGKTIHVYMPTADKVVVSPIAGSFDLAYAISCHKSQGSQWPVAIVMLDEYPGAVRLCDRSWIYTAISRAEKLCLLVGQKQTADAMCRKSLMQKRKTFLREMI